MLGQVFSGASACDQVQLQGKYPAQNSFLEEGGGASMGGGGASMGGGGASMGGGGNGNGQSHFSRTNAILLNDRFGNVSGLGTFNFFLGEAYDPSKWCKGGAYFCSFLRKDPYLRGLDQMLLYRPGSRVGSQNLVNKDFLALTKCYLRSKSAACLDDDRDHLAVVPWEKFRLSPSLTYGIWSLRQVFKFQDPLTLIRKSQEGNPMLTTDLEVALISISAALKIGLPSHSQPSLPSLDVFTCRVDPIFPFWIVRSFRVVAKETP